MEDRPNYYAVIPADIRYDSTLRANAKLMYGEITALASKYGECTASNNYFAKLYEVDSSAISRWINQLKEKNYIEVDYEMEGKEIKRRIIRIVGIDKYQYLLTKEQEGYCQKRKENNTRTNNTSKKEIYKERFKIPTIEEIENYIKENNLNVNGEKFFKFYNDGNWIDTNGKKVKNWKGKLLTWNNYEKPKESIPDWFDTTQNIKRASDREQKEMEEFLNEYS